MKQLPLGTTTLILFYFYADTLPGFLSLFGLIYFVWLLIGVALICAGIEKINKKGKENQENDWTEEMQRSINQHL